MDLDPKGVNNQIKEAIDKRYVTDEDSALARLGDSREAADFVAMFMFCLAGSGVRSAVLVSLLVKAMLNVDDVVLTVGSLEEPVECLIDVR